MASIRDIQQDDVHAIAHAFCFPWTTIEASQEKWTCYFAEHQAGQRTTYLLEDDGVIRGYASLLRSSTYPHFKNAAIPEIHDVWIQEDQRRQGFGKRLIKHLEAQALKEGYTQIGLGVGLYQDYGQAQRLYFSLGYAPDGKGITYKNEPVTPGKDYPVDDDLLLWLIKPLIAPND